MKLGISTIITDDGIRPDVLAKALEERGFDSLVVAEHSHVPCSRATPYPAGGELPHEYYRVYDPFVAVTAAAVATSELLVGTGVLLLAQRDTIQTAKEVASADHIADGRVLLGLGLGWNLEEIADHGIDPATRGTLLDEKLAAMKELWSKEEAEFHGVYVDFDLIFCWPRPVQQPHPPVYFGRSTAPTSAASAGLLRRIHRGHGVPSPTAPSWLDTHGRPAREGPRADEPSRRCNRHSGRRRCPRRRGTYAPRRLPRPPRGTSVNPAFHPTRI